MSKLEKMAAMDSARVMLVFEETDRTPEWTLLDYNLHPTVSDFEEKIKHSFMPFASVINLYLGKAVIPPWESSRILRDGDEVYVSMVEWTAEMVPGTAEEGQWVVITQEAVGGTSEEQSGSHKEKKKKKRKKKRSHSPMETEEDGPALTKGKKGCLVRHEEEPEMERPKKRVRLNVDVDRAESSAESGPVTEGAFQNSLAPGNLVNEKGDGNTDTRKENSVQTSTPVEVSKDEGKSKTSAKRRSYNPNQRLSIGMFLEALRSAESSESATAASEQGAVVPETEKTEEAGSGEEVSTAEDGEVKRKRKRRRRKSSKNGKELEVSDGELAKAETTAPSSSLKLPRHKRPANVRIVFNSDSEGEGSESPQASTSFSASPGQQLGKSASRAGSHTPELQPKAACSSAAGQREDGCNLPRRKPKPDTPMPGTAATQFKMPAPVPAAPVECRKTMGKDGVATFIRERHGNSVHQLTPYPNVPKLSRAQQLNDRVTHKSIVVKNSSPSVQMVSNGGSQDLCSIDQSAEALEIEHNSSENLDGSYTEPMDAVCEDVVDQEMDAHVRKKLSGSFDYACQEEQAEEVDVEEEDEDYSNGNTTFAGRTPKKIPRDYNKCPPLKGTPCPGIVIAYKAVELSNVTYTPELSEYQEARVLCFDPSTNQVTLKPIHTTNQQARKPGKFDLVYDDKIFTTTQSEDCKVLTWSDVISPRVVK